MKQTLMICWPLKASDPGGHDHNGRTLFISRIYFFLYSYPSSSSLSPRSRSGSKPKQLRLPPRSNQCSMRYGPGLFLGRLQRQSNCLCPPDQHFHQLPLSDELWHYRLLLAGLCRSIPDRPSTTKTANNQSIQMAAAAPLHQHGAGIPAQRPATAGGC